MRRGLRGVRRARAWIDEYVEMTTLLYKPIYLYTPWPMAHGRLRGTYYLASIRNWNETVPTQFLWATQRTDQQNIRSN